MPSSESYDAEAIDLLARAADASRPQTELRIEAARQLLDGLVALNEYVPGGGTNSVRNGTYLFALKEGATVALRIDEANYNGILVGLPGKGMDLAPLEYDPVANKWTGKEFDQFLIPVPGQPRRKRSGLAIVIAAALKLLNQPAPKS